MRREFKIIGMYFIQFVLYLKLEAIGPCNYETILNKIQASISKVGFTKKWKEICEVPNKTEKC